MIGTPLAVTLGPTHSIDIAGVSTSVRRTTWYVYIGDQEVRTGQGYMKTSDSSFTLINPVQISKLDLAGRVIESISARKGSGVTASGKLLSTDTFARSTYARWTTYVFNNANRQTSMKEYHLIPGTGAGTGGTNYTETLFAYDNRGRQNKVTAPGGTITETTFNVRGLSTTVKMGTATGALKTVSTFEYDNNLAGKDGNLTKRTEYASDSDTRVTTHVYDWRNSLETTDGEVDMFEKLYYDNLDRVVKTERYNTTAAGVLTARSESKYDERGRIYQTIRHEVNITTGAVGGRLTDNRWYDCCGNVIKEQPGGSQQFTKFVYDGLGRLKTRYVGYDAAETTYAQAEGVTSDTVFEQTTNTYDAASNLIDTRTLHRYHDATATGALAANASARPEYAAMWHDAVGRQIAIAQYGNQGNDGTAFTRPATVPARSDTILVSSTEFNAGGEGYRTLDPAGKDDRVEFDDAGRRTKTIENYVDGNPDTLGYDQDVTVEFTYNADGNLATIKAKNRVTGDQVTTYTYGTDATSDVFRNDLLVKETYPDSSGGTDVVLYTYNRQGQVKTKKDQNQSTHTFIYDKLGRQKEDQVVTGSGVDQAVKRMVTSYDVRGLVTAVASYNASTGGSVVNEVVREYNNMGMLTKEFQSHAGAKTGTTPAVSYGYDTTVVSGELTKGLRPATITYPNGRIVNYNYAGNDAINLNRISNVITGTFGGGGAVQSSYKYLGMNTVVEVDHEEPDVKLDLIGSAHAYSGFDRFGRVIDQKWRDYGSSVDADRYTYGYDRASNRRYRENTLTAAKDEFYTYDGVHRLSVADRGDLNAGKTAITGTPPRKFTYELDPTGNWNAYTIQNSGALELLQGRTHNKANETDGGADDFQTAAGTDWANVTHDANGNTTVLPQPNSLGSAYTLTYDAWNRVTKVQNGGATVADYSYDGLNRRITKTASGTLRHFYYSDQWQVVEERVGSDPDPADHYIWGLRYVDDLILRDRDTAATPDGTFDQRHYYLQDANFNVTAITNHTGDVQERYVYEPYGAVSYFTAAWASSTASFANPYQFTGRRLDAETGLYGYRNRMYHAQLGRFVSRDPISYRAGFNLCVFLRSAPLRGVDPSGYQAIGADPTIDGPPLPVIDIPFPDPTIFEPSDPYIGFEEELEGLIDPILLSCGDFLRRIARMRRQDGKQLSPEVTRALECNVNIFCGDCGKMSAVTLPVPGVILRPRPTHAHICLDRKSKAGVDDWEGLLIHEAVHVVQALDAGSCGCSPRPYRGRNPIIRPGGVGGPNCKRCRDLEDPAYTAQAKFLAPNDPAWQRRFVAWGVCNSCKNPCRTRRCPPKPEPAFEL